MQVLWIMQKQYLGKIKFFDDSLYQSETIIFCSVEHVYESIKLYLNRKKLQFYTRRAFLSTGATACHAAFFSIGFYHLFSAKTLKTSQIV